MLQVDRNKEVSEECGENCERDKQQYQYYAKDYECTVQLQWERDQSDQPRANQGLLKKEISQIANATYSIDGLRWGIVCLYLNFLIFSVDEHTDGDKQRQGSDY